MGAGPDHLSMTDPPVATTESLNGKEEEEVDFAQQQEDKEEEEKNLQDQDPLTLHFLMGAGPDHLSMTDPPVATTEILNGKEEEEVDFAQQQEDKEEEEKNLQDQDPTIQNGTGIKEEEEKNGDNFDIEDIFPFSQQQEDDEEEEKKLQDSTEKVKWKGKEGEKGKKEDEQQKSTEQKEAAQNKKKEQINHLIKQVGRFPKKYKGFMDDADQDEHLNITNLLSAALDEDKWDRSIYGKFLMRIELLKFKLQKQLDGDITRANLSRKLESDLGNEAQRIHDQSEVLRKLRSELELNLSKLEYQQSQVPTDELSRKLRMGETLRVSMEEMTGQLPYVIKDFNDLVAVIEKWNEILLEKTFWDHSPDNKGKTKIGRIPALDYVTVKIETFTFNPKKMRLGPFVEYFRDRACDHPQHGKLKSEEGQFETVREVCLLQLQTTPEKQPPRWFIVHLEYDAARADMHVRSDNLYIGGFANKYKQIYELGNSDCPPLLKGSLPFGCDCDYKSLMNFERVKVPPDDQEIQRLMELALNMWNFGADIEAMSNYDHKMEEELAKKPGEWEQIVKRTQQAVARTAIVLPEVCRFLVLFGLVEDGWDNELGSYLTNLFIAYMRHWKIMAKRLRNAEVRKLFSDAENKEIKMTHVYEAFEVLYLALNYKADGGSGTKKKAKGDGPSLPPPPPPDDDSNETHDHDSKHKATPPSEPKAEGGDDSQGVGGNEKTPQKDKQKGDEPPPSGNEDQRQDHNDRKSEGGSDSQGIGENDKVLEKDQVKGHEPALTALPDHFFAQPSLLKDDDYRDVLPPPPGAEAEAGFEHTLALPSWPEIPSPRPKRKKKLRFEHRLEWTTWLERQPGFWRARFQKFAMPGLSVQGSHSLSPVPKLGQARWTAPEPKEEGGSGSCCLSVQYLKTLPHPTDSVDSTENVSLHVPDLVPAQWIPNPEPLPIISIDSVKDSLHDPLATGSMDSSTEFSVPAQRIPNLETLGTKFSSVKANLHELLQRWNADNATATSAMKFKLSGQPLVEVFSIHTNNPCIKTVSIYDDRGGRFVYRTKDGDIVNFFEQRDIWLSSHPAMDSCDYMEELVLTGPSRGMSADPGFVIEVDVDDDIGVFDLPWSWEKETAVDIPILQSVFTSRGQVHVSAMVISNAVQAHLDFMLFFPNLRSGVKLFHVSGRLKLHVDNCAVGVVMFNCPTVCHLEPTCLEKVAGMCEEGVVGTVPLVREIFALPADKGFRVKGELFVSGNKIVIDHSIELKDLLGGLCKWPVSVQTENPRLVSHAFLRVSTSRPF